MANKDSQVEGDLGRVLTIRRAAHFVASDRVYLQIHGTHGTGEYADIIVPGEEFRRAVIEQFKDG